MAAQSQLSTTRHARTDVPDNIYKSIAVNDTTIHYLELGTRSAKTPTLILCHGHIADLRSFDKIQPLLSDHFHLINYSRRFSWPNKPILAEERDDWQLHARDMAELITKLDLAPVHVLGNSSGAAAPLILAQTRPELFASLILEEPPLPYVFLPRLPPTPWDLLSCLFTHPTAFLSVLMFGINVMGPTTNYCKADPPNKSAALNVFTPGACGKSAWADIKDSPDQSRMQQVLDNVDVMVNLFRFDDTPVISTEDLAKVSCPLLMLTGSDTISAQKCIDWKVVASVSSKVKKERIIEGARHFVHEDQPQRVREAVVAWVRELDAMESKV